MAGHGLRTTELTSSAAVDELLANNGGQTVRQPVPSFVQQLIDNKQVGRPHYPTLQEFIDTDMSGVPEGTIIRVVGGDQIKVALATAYQKVGFEPMVFDDEDAFAASRQPGRWLGATWVIGDLLYSEAASEATDHQLINVSGVKLKARRMPEGHFALRSFGVRPITAIVKPTPANNAAMFQAFIDGHDANQKLVFPNWEIDLGASIDTGGRNVDGQGDATVLNFIDVPADQDLFNFEAGPSGNGAGLRGGVLRHFVIKANRSGREALWLRGGPNTLLEHITVIEPGRDAYRVEQVGSGAWMEKNNLRHLWVKDPGRYGVVIKLQEFGADDVQFINKLEMNSVTVRGAAVADFVFELGDNDPALNTKIGGGVMMDNCHAAFSDTTATTRAGSSILIIRGANSKSRMEFLNMENCTFEDKSAGLNYAMGFVDNSTVAAADEHMLLGLQSVFHLTTGYNDMVDPANLDLASPTRQVAGTYYLKSAQRGVITNEVPQVVGTRFDRPGATSVPANGNSAALLDAGVTAGFGWKVKALLSSGSGPHVEAIVQSHPTSPKIDIVSQSGDLSASIVGTDLVLTNADTSTLFAYVRIDPWI